MMRFLRELSSPFVWKLAFRDAKPQWRTLLLYTSSVIAGVAALVAILSFRSDVLLTVQAQSKELLGADLELRSGDPFPKPVGAFTDSVGGEEATARESSARVIFDVGGRSRLSQIRAIDGPSPFTESWKLCQQRPPSLISRAGLPFWSSRPCSSMEFRSGIPSRWAISGFLSLES